MTKPQRRLMARVRQDGCLMHVLHDGYRFIDGTAAHSGVVRRLIEAGKLLENGDAMFGAPSQTLRAA